MSDFVPKRVYMERISLHPFIQKESAAEAHRIIENYCDPAPSETTCRDWFRCFKNSYFDVEVKEHFGTLKKFEDKELETLPHEDSYQAPAKLAESLEVDYITVLKCLKALRLIQKLVH